MNRTEIVSRITRNVRRDEISALFEISNRLRHHQDIEKVLTEIIKVCGEWLCAEACTLGLEDEASGDIHFHMVHGANAERLQKKTLSRGRGILGWCVANRQALNVPDASADYRFDGSFDQKTNFHTRSILCVPMIHRNKCIGAIEVINKTGETPQFTRQDEKLLTILSDQAAAAVDFAWIQEKLARDKCLSAIGSLTAQIIHDLRNPLAAVKSCVDLIAVHHPESSRLTDNIQRESRRISDMLQEILDFTRGVNHLNLEPVEISALMDEVCDVTPFLAKGKNVTLEKSEWPDLRIMMDRERMRRALLNLVSNALDVIPPGGILKLTARRDGDNVAFEVWDSGPGMDEETRTRLFEPLFTKGKRNGTGLGLSIVQSIVTSHHGSIEVESALGRGTTFFLRIPTAQPETATRELAPTTS